MILVGDSDLGQSKLLDFLFKPDPFQWLCEAVCEHVLRGDIGYLESSILHKLPDEVVVYGDMLCSGVEYRVSREVDAGFIISI